MPLPETLAPAFGLTLIAPARLIASPSGSESAGSLIDITGIAAQVLASTICGSGSVLPPRFDDRQKLIGADPRDGFVYDRSFSIEIRVGRDGATINPRNDGIDAVDPAVVVIVRLDRDDPAVGADAMSRSSDRLSAGVERHCIGYGFSIDRLFSRREIVIDPDALGVFLTVLVNPSA